MTEVSRRWDHLMQNMPLAVFGGKNTGLKGGTFLKITDGSLPAQGSVSGAIGAETSAGTAGATGGGCLSQ